MSKDKQTEKETTEEVKEASYKSMDEKELTQSFWRDIYDPIMDGTDLDTVKSIIYEGIETGVDEGKVDDTSYDKILKNIDKIDDLNKLKKYVSNSLLYHEGHAKDIKNTKKNKEKHYVNAKEFIAEVLSYYDSDKISNKLSMMIHKIAHGLGYAPNFINYSYKEEMIGDALVGMFKALSGKKYVHKPGRNPFSYFNTIAYHAFLNRIKKEKKIHEAVKQYQEEMYDCLMDEYKSDGPKNEQYNEDF